MCSGPDVAGAVVDLVDRSLVQADTAGSRSTYRLLETVRVSAADRLVAMPSRTSTVNRFIRYHADLTEHIASGLYTADEPEWARRFDEHTANLRAALTLALDRRDVDAAVRIAGAPYLLVYQRLRGDIGEWAELALPAAREAGHPAAIAVAAVAALGAINRDEPGRALAMLADLPDDPLARHAHEVLAELHVYRGDLDLGLDHLCRAEALARVAGDRFTELYSQVSQAIALGYHGRAGEGRRLVARIRRRTASLPNPLLAAWCDYAEGELLSETDPHTAIALVDRAVEAAEAGGWEMLAGASRLTAGSLRARVADAADAVPRFQQLVRHWADRGDHTHQWTTLRNVVELLVRVDDHRSAAELLGALVNASTPTFGPEAQRLSAALGTVRARLGPEADRLLAAGGAHDLRRAVQLAMSALSRLAA